MHTSMSWLAAIATAASVASTASRGGTARPRTTAAPPCATDSNYQRLAFWVGDWEVLDSTGARYATQRVRAVIDACAITAEWTGGVGDRGISLSAFDGRTAEWRQVYVSNQVPVPLGVTLRRSDPSYGGPGLRFVPLVESPAGSSETRVTIMPSSDHRVMELFESSRDGGKTWALVFKADHRLRQTGDARPDDRP
jgi:hypothetical protein